MIDLLIAYGFFLLKMITVLAVILIPIMVISSSNKHRKETDKGRIIVKNLSDKLEEIGVSLKRPGNKYLVLIAYCIRFGFTNTHSAPYVAFR